MKTLVIIPAYNESKNIERLLTTIRTLGKEFDVVVINDASIDNTSYLAKKTGFQVIDLPANLGIGGAMQTGYLYAYYNLYDIAVQLDGDGQHDPREIDKIIAPLIAGEADMVIGSRFIENHGFQSTFMRRFGIRFFKGLIRFLTGQKFTDPTSGFRACNKAIIAHFAMYYPFDYPEPETLVTMSRKGYKLIEIPVVMYERESGHSSIQSLKQVYYMVKVTLAILIEMLKNYKLVRYTYDGDKAAAFSDHS